MKSTFSFGVLIVITVLGIANCTKKINTTATQEYKIGISQEFENLNPIIMSMAASSYMYSMVGRTLAILDSNGKWVPQLAKSLPTLENGGAQIITENGVKKIKAIWEIKENAKWGDGVPLTCDDFVFTQKVVASPFVSVGEKETYTQVEKIEIDPLNPKKCTFTYDKLRWDFNRLGSLRPLSKHIEEPIFNQYGKEKEGYEKNTNYVKNPTNPGLYSGPYVVADVKLGSHVVFTINPHFYGTPAKIQKIIVKVIPNTGTLEANLRSGQIDAISTLGLSFDQAIAFDKKVKAESLPYTVLFQPSSVYEHIDLNLENPILKDIRVRKALVYAINREDLTTALFEGRQLPADHFISPVDPWFTKDTKYVTYYKYSKEEAGKLLDEAGWKLAADGFRAKGGEKLSLSIMTTAQNKTRELVQQYLKDQWKQIGVDVEIKNEPARVFFGETTKKRKFPSMAMYAWVSSPESPAESTFHSKNIPSEKNGWSGQNTVAWVNPKMDKLFELIKAEFNPEKRTEYAREMLKLYTDEVPSIPLYYRSDVAVIPSLLKGFKLPGHQFAETNDVENWMFEGAALK
jgi:peptide/nickel transport system substrate-binding protein